MDGLGKRSSRKFLIFWFHNHLVSSSLDFSSDFKMVY
jgi:hypothetical protein